LFQEYPDQCTPPTEHHRSAIRETAFPSAGHGETPRQSYVDRPLYTGLCSTVLPARTSRVGRGRRPVDALRLSLPPRRLPLDTGEVAPSGCRGHQPFELIDEARELCLFLPKHGPRFFIQPVRFQSGAKEAAHPLFDPALFEVAYDGVNPE
jgi:hypothetical protein